MINILRECYRCAIRYEVMLPMTYRAFAYSNDNQLNIYIDLYPIFRTLLSPDYLEMKSPVDITSGVLNLAAHYRQFFRKYFKTESKIYFINSFNVNQYNLNTYPGYNNELIHRFETRTLQMSKLMDTNLKLLETLIPYIPEVYMIKSSYESAVVMYDLIQNYSEGHPNLIISRDEYVKQLIGICKNTVLYRPKNEMSYYVVKKNLYQSILYENKIDFHRYDFSDISPGLVSLFMTLNGLKCRKIKQEFNIVKTMNILRNGINNMIILNRYNSYIDWNTLQSLRDPNHMNNIYSVIDIPTQYAMYKNDIESHYNFQDLYDPESVQAINNIYFTNNNQINLNEF